VHAPAGAGATFIRSTPASATAPVFEIRARPLDDLRTDVRSLAAKPAARPGTPSGGIR
jgi:hypothetical protein